MMKNICQALAILTLLSVAFWVGRRSVAPLAEMIETVQTDTIYRDRFVPIASTIRPVAVSIPRLLFVRPDADEATAGVDLIEQETPIAADSVVLNVAIETRTYRDSLLTAQISGPAIGDYHPQLDWYEVYNQTRTVTQTVTKRNRFAVTAGAGASWTPEGIRPSINVQIGVILWSF